MVTLSLTTEPYKYLLAKPKHFNLYLYYSNRKHDEPALKIIATKTFEKADSTGEEKTARLATPRQENNFHRKKPSLNFTTSKWATNQITSPIFVRKDLFKSRVYTGTTEI